MYLTDQLIALEGNESAHQRSANTCSNTSAKRGTPLARNDWWPLFIYSLQLVQFQFVSMELFVFRMIYFVRLIRKELQQQPVVYVRG